MRMTLRPPLLHVYVAVIAALLACGVRTRAQEPIPLEADQPFVHEASGMTFPAHLGTFTRSSADRFDDNGRNISVGYVDRGQKILISVYVYPHGGKTLKEHFEKVKRDVAQVQPQARLASEGEWKLTQGQRDEEDDEQEAARDLVREFTGRKATYHFTMRGRGGEDEALVSEAYLLRHGGFFLKFRVTCPADNHPAAAERVERFLKRLTLPERPVKKK
jgi:hypothetical protein